MNQSVSAGYRLGQQRPSRLPAELKAHDGGRRIAAELERSAIASRVGSPAVAAARPGDIGAAERPSARRCHLGTGCPGCRRTPDVKG